MLSSRADGTISASPQSQIIIAGPDASRGALAEVLRRRTGGRFEVDEAVVAALPSVIGTGKAFQVLILCEESFSAALSGDLLQAFESRPWLYVIAPVRASYVFDTYTAGHQVEVFLSLAKAYRHFVFTNRLKRIEAALLSPEEGELPRTGEAVGTSEPIWRILHYLGAVAGFGLPLILVGEPGSGRLEIARAAHNMLCAGAPFVTLRVSGMSARQVASAIDHAADGRSFGPGCRWGTLLLRGIEDLDEEALSVLSARCFSHAAMPLFDPPGADAAAAGELVCVVSIDAERLAGLEARAPLRRFVARHGDLTIRIPPLRERPEDVPVLAEDMAHRVCRELGLPESTVSRAVSRLSADEVLPGNRYTLQAELVRHATEIRREQAQGALKGKL